MTRVPDGLRYAEAGAAFERVTRLDPNNAFAWVGEARRILARL